MYFAWINPEKDYECIIAGQMKDLLASGIMSVSKLYVQVCCENNELVDSVQAIFRKVLGNTNYEIEVHGENLFEYYGINKLHSLAVSEPSKYYFYFHSKGMFNYNNTRSRNRYELTLTRGTISNWKKAIEVFKSDDAIMKIGLFPARQHKNNYIWFNFWYARGTFLATCEKPKKSGITGRFYYESVWIETGTNDELGVYNLLEPGHRKYSLDEAGAILNGLNGHHEAQDVRRVLLRIRGK